MATWCAEIALAWADLPILCGRFQAVAHKSPCRPNVQRRPCWLNFGDASSATARPFPRKEAMSQVALWAVVSVVVGKEWPALYRADEP